MAKYLIERNGCGKFAVGEVVELSDSQAAFYAAKVKQLSETAEQSLEVATPKPKRRRRKPKTEKPAG